MEDIPQLRTKKQGLLTISQIILSYPLADSFEFRACFASRCLCSQNINKYSNKPTKGYKRMIQRFELDLTTLINMINYLPFFHCAAMDPKNQSQLGNSSQYNDKYGLRW